MTDRRVPSDTATVDAPLREWIRLANRFSEAIEARNARYCKVTLVLLLSISIALSCQGFLFGPIAEASLEMGSAKWVYLAVAIGVAACIWVYERVPRCRTYAFALATTVFGASFLVLGYQPTVGSTVVLATPIVAAMIGVVEFCRARFEYADRGASRAGAWYQQQTRSSPVTEPVDSL